VAEPDHHRGKRFLVVLALALYERLSRLARGADGDRLQAYLGHLIITSRMLIINDLGVVVDLCGEAGPGCVGLVDA